MNVHAPVTVPITYEMVARAYQKVKQGGKASGVDGQSWKSFEEKGVEKQLYVIWRRLSSGSYFPQAVREVEIPKANGKKRKLGIPTMTDRIAQQVVKTIMEQRVDSMFHDNSYGYRPMKSSAQALESVRQNCFKRDWVVDLDITKFFDEIDHELLLKAVEYVMPDRWIHVYVKRWLEMKIERADGTTYDRGNKGTPQGGVISPLLANLFLHFGLDQWLEKEHPTIAFVRYADDIILHCASKAEADQVLQQIKQRLEQIHLRLNEEKSKIVYCKDYLRQERHEHVQFDFLGFSFQPRPTASTRNPGTSYTIFAGEISRKKKVHILGVIRDAVNWRNTIQELSTIAMVFNPKLRGWINYFGLFGKRHLTRTLQHLDQRIIKFLMRKHKCGYRHAAWLLAVHQQSTPHLFYHWSTRYSFQVQRINTSRMR